MSDLVQSLSEDGVAVQLMPAQSFGKVSVRRVRTQDRNDGDSR